jgi:exopolysaccharide biosynthesis polyprenyl glycosylphosphotransferase
MSEGVIPEVASAAVPQVSLERTLLGRHAVGADGVRLVAGLGKAFLVWFSLFVLYAQGHRLTTRDLLALTVAALVWIVVLRAMATSGEPVLGPIVTTGVGTMLGLVPVAALNSSAIGLHRSVLALAALALAVFCSAVVWDWFVYRTAAGRRRVLLVGTDGVETLSQELSGCRRPAFDVVGTVAGSGSAELDGVIEAQRPDVVVIADDVAYEAVLESLLTLRPNARVAGIASFFEYALGRIPVEQITPAWFTCLLHPRQRTYSRLVKRAFDLVVAGVALVIAAPLLAVLALLTKTDGPAFYRQSRVGERGRTFTIYKLRTMACDAESNGATFSLDGDPRVTGLGSFLRRTHLDELPQLWNVLKGDMSVVGPRPERPEFIASLESTIPYWSRRLLVKPGITGWAQLRCSYASDCEGMRRKLSYDLWYLRHGSLFVDLAVCFTTLFETLESALTPEEDVRRSEIDASRRRASSPRGGRGHAGESARERRVGAVAQPVPLLARSRVAGAERRGLAQHPPSGSAHPFAALRSRDPFR